jgi:hypothetical protein
MSSTTETAHWPSAAPRRADNVETAPLISEDWLSASWLFFADIKPPLAS